LILFFLIRKAIQPKPNIMHANAEVKPLALIVESSTVTNRDMALNQHAPQ